jgi:hypothetical protein
VPYQFKFYTTTVRENCSVKYDIVFVMPNGAIRIKIPPFDSA